MLPNRARTRKAKLENADDGTSCHEYDSMIMMSLCPELYEIRMLYFYHKLSSYGQEVPHGEEKPAYYGY